MNAAKPILLISLFFCTGNALAQTDDKEPAGVRAAANRSLTEGLSSFVPTVAVDTDRELVNALLKRQLACKFGSDREGYNEAKSEFVRRILRRTL